MRAKDTPNFIANRIGTFAMMRTLAVAVEQGYTVEEVDMVFGPATGKPKSGVFRTADVVGLDTLMHVTKNCHDALTADERRVGLRAATCAEGAGRQEVARQQDQAGLLQEGRRRHPAARPQDAGVRAADQAALRVDRRGARRRGRRREAAPRARAATIARRRSRAR